MKFFMLLSIPEPEQEGSMTAACTFSIFRAPSERHLKKSPFIKCLLTDCDSWEWKETHFSSVLNLLKSSSNEKTSFLGK